MGVESGLGNITRGVRSGIFDAITQGGMNLEGIVGNVGAMFSPIWDGGFAGISKEGLTALNQRLEKYCQELDEIIQRFNENANTENALKGEVQTAAQDFIRACKELLTAYVTHIREQIKDSKQAFANYQAATGQAGIAGSVQGQADELRTQAQSIKVDPVDPTVG